jgi:hypothetical protein
MTETSCYDVCCCRILEIICCMHWYLARLACTHPGCLLPLPCRLMSSARHLSSAQLVHQGRRGKREGATSREGQGIPPASASAASQVCDADNSWAEQHPWLEGR